MGGMKGVFVVLDGVADEPSSVLGGKTPLEYAKTPNLDEIAKKSKLDYCYVIKEGISPESSSAVVSLLGYDYRNAPRGPLEAQGAGIKLTKGDLALRVNFATIDDLNGGHLLDSRAGRTLTSKEARILADAINKEVKLPFKFELHPTVQHRGVLVFRGGFSDNVSNADPHYSNGMAVGSNSGKMVFSKPLDDEDDSKLSADLVNSFIRHSHEVLDKHPVNLARARKGLYSANILLARDAGNSQIRFRKLKGKWIALGYMPLEKGIAKAAGMDVYQFRYPELKGIDVYSLLYTGLKKSIKNAIKMLRRNKKKYDYFYIHIKETDIPGHDGKPRDKVDMIELLDRRFFSYLKRFIGDSKLIITADHTTSCRQKSHTADPVPVLFYPHPKGEVKEKRFVEEQSLEGRKVLGKKVLEHFYGK